jgi:DNA-binding XRE family transcriptional regulator
VRPILTLVFPVDVLAASVRFHVNYRSTKLFARRFQSPELSLMSRAIRERVLEVAKPIRLEFFHYEIPMDYDPLPLFGKRLVELRKKLGWSQEGLANESGIARSYLGEVERGKRNIALINISKLANTLGRGAISAARVRRAGREIGR